MSLFQSKLRKQIRNLPKILNFVKIIRYYSKLFTGVLTSLPLSSPTLPCQTSQPRHRPAGRHDPAASGGRLHRAPGPPRERSAKIKLKIQKTCFENWINTILKIKDLAAKIKSFRKMLHFGKIQKKIGEIWRKFSKIWPDLGKFAKFWGNRQKIQRFLTKISRLESGAKECIV